MRIWATTIEERIARNLGRDPDRVREYGPADELRDERIARERLRPRTGAVLVMAAKDARPPR